MMSWRAGITVEDKVLQMFEFIGALTIGNLIKD